MNEKMYHDIFDKIQNGLPNGWKKVVVFIAYTTGSYSMKYYVYDETNNYKDCFQIVGKGELIKMFMSIDAIIKPVRASLVEKDKWTVLTMNIENTGKIKVDFEYENVDENLIAYEKEWKARYI